MISIGPCSLARALSVLRDVGPRRYLGCAPAASRVCEKIGAPGLGGVSSRQKQSDPEGGIPSGSLEVTWKVEDLVAWEVET